MSPVDWASLTAEDAAHKILTCYHGPLAHMPPDTRVLELCGSGERLLDLGAGVGRNAFYLADYFRDVLCFDLPNMVRIAQELDPPPNVRFTTDWAEVLHGRYDVALASIVLQHLRPSLVHRWLHQLEPITDRLIVVSRGYSDFGRSPMLPMVQEHYTVEVIEESGDHFWAVCRP